MQRNIAGGLRENANQQDEILRTFHFIVQSLAFYKANLKSDGASPLEGLYLNEKITVLIKLIDRYCDIDEKTNYKRGTKTYTITSKGDVK